ncbi:MAG: ribbon-helix-helix protein, CopG family [Thermoproteus sp. AZ2]|jgi:NRPS condensation-like uncharacterized protein|uniref:Ribbon-helix-helix protein, CopG family n=1 Tax=Thermoproteus sp. AZ2 TaxID=1609232 RepID=A0ACC6V3D0_9CREN
MIRVKIPKEVLKALEERAKREGLTVEDVIAGLLEAYLREKLAAAEAF